jgi:hypothetical protein
MPAGLVSLLANFSDGLGLGGAQRRDAVALGADGVGFGQILADGLLHFGLQGVGVFRLEVEGLLGGVFGQLDDRVDHRLHFLVGEVDAAQDDLFRELLDFAFDHHHGVGGAGHDQVHLAFLQLVERRVQHVPPLT